MATEKYNIQNDLNELQPKVDDLENRLQGSLEDRSRLQAELEKVKKAFEEHRRESEEMIKEVTVEDGSLEAGVDMGNEIEAGINEREGIDIDIASWQSKYNMLQTNYDNLNTDKKRLEEKLDNMQSTVINLDYQNQTLNSDKNKLNFELEAAKRKINDLLSELDAEKNEKESLKLEYESLERKCSKIEAEYEIHTSTRQENEETGAYVKLQEAYKRSHERENESQAELLNCYKVISELKHQTQDANETIERLTINYNTETVRSATLRDEVVSYQRRLSELEERYDISQKAKEDTEQELKLLQQRVEELSRENRSIQESKGLIMAEVTNQRNKITRLEQQLEESEFDKESLRLHLSAWQSKKEGDLHEISRQISSLSERRQSQRLNKEGLNNQLISMRRRMNKLQRENEALRSEGYYATTKKETNDGDTEQDKGEEDRKERRRRRRERRRERRRRKAEIEGREDIIEDGENLGNSSESSDSGDKSSSDEEQS